MELDEKVRWIDLKGELYKMITQDVSDEEKEAYEGGLYESPKTYVNGFALNDGTWVKYIHNGKLWCKNKREVERYLKRQGWRSCHVLMVKRSGSNDSVLNYLNDLKATYGDRPL